MENTDFRNEIELNWVRSAHNRNNKYHIIPDWRHKTNVLNILMISTYYNIRTIIESAYRLNEKRSR